MLQPNPLYTFFVERLSSTPHQRWKRQWIQVGGSTVLRCQLNAVIDLSTDSDVPLWLGLGELLNEDWNTANTNGRESCSQAFGRAVSERSEALLVPSARRVGVNLVIYPKSLRPDSIFEIEGQEELPP